MHSLQAPKYNQFTWNVIMDTMDKMVRIWHNDIYV